MSIATTICPNCGLGGFYFFASCFQVVVGKVWGHNMVYSIKFIRRK